MKILPLFLTLLLGAVATSQAATNFVIGSLASPSNPVLPATPNVWPMANGESPGNAIDGNLTNKYLNFGKLNTGYIFTGDAGIVTGINFVSGNDAVLRDPSSYILYGSNSAVASNTPGTIFDLDTFTIISSGAVSLPDDAATRNVTRTTFNTTFTNSLSFTTYALVFPTIKGSTDPTVNSMQIGEARLQTATGPLSNVGTIGGGQVVPEPSSFIMTSLAGVFCLMGRRRRK